MTDKNGYAPNSGDKLCAECGKTFFVRNHEDYAWKLNRNNGTQWFCRYTHMVHWRDRDNERHKQVMIERANKKDAK